MVQLLPNIHHILDNSVLVEIMKYHCKVPVLYIICGAGNPPGLHVVQSSPIVQ